MRIVILSERSKSKDLSRRVVILSERNEPKDLSSHPMLAQQGALKGGAALR